MYDIVGAQLNMPSVEADGVAGAAALAFVVAIPSGGAASHF